jgi:exodeoxyribonuclease V beta subunit
MNFDDPKPPIRYPKPSILAELSSDRHAVIEASAGTGKTYTLKHLVIELLLADDDIALDNVLVVTFTRRATADLKRQIRGILNEVLNAFETGDHLCDEDQAHWHIDQAKADRLRDAMLGFDRAEIYTIHSFCQKLLTENAFQNHQLFDLELVDEQALFEDCFADILRGPFSTDPKLSKWLDAWLMPAVNGRPDDLGDKLYKAYSSSGELRRASNDESAEALLDKAREKARDGKSLGRNDQHQLCTAILQKFMAPVVEELQRRKERDGLYCYSDMLSLVARSLERAEAGDPTSQAFRQLVREQYRYALIDEFQDTDQEQWEIFRNLFVGDGDERDEHDKHRIYIIGDPKQAIYRFRGADVWTYLRAADHIQSRGGTARLEHNFRSTHEMVRAYNAVLDQAVLDQAVRDQQPRNGEPFFTNEHINYANPVKPNPVTRRRVRRASDQSTPAAITAMHVDVEGKKDDIAPRWLDWMATEIESILWGEGQLEVDEGALRWQPVDAGDIFVLTNSNAEARQVGQLLRERGIPYAFYRQDGLFRTHEAMDIAALLRGVAEPGAREHRRAAYRTPFFAVPIRHLADFDDDAGDATSPGHAAYQTLLDWHELADNREFTRLFRKVFEDSGLLRRELLVGDGERALSNYQQIFELLTQRASSGHASAGQAGDDLAGLISWLDAQIDGDDDSGRGDEDENIQRLETDRPAVQLMTMHKSKGLEAEIVFIYGGFASSGGRMPTVIDHDDPTDDAAERVTFISSSKSYLTEEPKRRLDAQNEWESQRLMYVALTRAKSRLYLCYAGKAAKYGRKGRHEALCRSLDRLHEQNPVPDDLEFVDVGPPGSHPETCAAAEVSMEDLLQAPAHLDAFDQALDAGDAGNDGVAGSDKHKRTYGDIRRSARQAVSFSGVRAYQGRERVELFTTEEQDELTWDEMVRGDRFSANTAVLGGGPAPGSFLHDILECIDDYTSVLRHDDASSWLTDPQVRRTFDEQLDRHGIARRFEAYSARILYETLRASIDLPGGPSLEALAEADSFAKEVSFRFPIPEESRPLGQWPDDAPTIERGWVEGQIDLVFEHSGRIYIADWKSNTRPDYAPRQIAPYVDNHYALQAQLYTLATVRMLGIGDEDHYDRLFGGCAYFFVRGMRPDRDDGVVWCRPSWAELVEWDAKLGRESTRTWKTPTPVFSQTYLSADASSNDMPDNGRTP